jgi:hypothetical protein
MLSSVLLFSSRICSPSKCRCPGVPEYDWGSVAELQIVYRRNATQRNGQTIEQRPLSSRSEKLCSKWETQSDCLNMRYEQSKQMTGDVP